MIKILMASGLMGLACLGSYAWMESVITPLSTWSLGLALAVSIGSGLLTLFIASRAMRISELDSALLLIMKKLRSR